MYSAVFHVTGACLGAAALWLLLPRETRSAAFHRTLAAAIALATSALMLFVSQSPTPGNFAACLVFYPAACIALTAGVAAIVSRSPSRPPVWFALFATALVVVLLVQRTPWFVVAAVPVHAIVTIVTARRTPRRAATDRLAEDENVHTDQTCREPLLSAAIGAVALGAPAVALARVFNGDAVAHSTGGEALSYNSLLLAAAFFAVGLVGFVGRKSAAVQLTAAGILSQGILLSLVAWDGACSQPPLPALPLLVLVVAACHGAIASAFAANLFVDRTRPENG